MNNYQYNYGDIILIKYPFTDLSNFKNRPALVLFSEGNDVLVTFISSILKNTSKDDIILYKNNINNLVVDSILKIKKINTLHITLINKKIGTLNLSEKKTVKDSYLKLFKESL